jgi:hypothetical protein
VHVPLLTSSGVANLTSGFLGDPTTTILIGPKDLSYGTLSGARFATGWWFTDEQDLGIDGGGFVVGHGIAHLGEGSTAGGWPVLVRPVALASDGTETGVRVAFPGALAGSFQVNTTSELWGFDVNTRARVIDRGYLTVEALVGFRYLDLDEHLAMDQNTQLLAGGVTGFNAGRILPVSAVTIHDGFDTRNQFYGGQIGGHLRWCKGGLVLDLLAKLAVGDTAQSRTIDGSTTLISPTGQTNTVSGGALALSPNLGKASADEIAVVTQIGLTAGYEVTHWLRLYVGYDFLHWGEVARPGDQITRSVGANQVPVGLGFVPPAGTTPTQPWVPVGHSDYWAHGVSFGVAFRY